MDLVLGILIATLVVGATGLAIGLLLGIAAKKFAVETDEREILVRELLPGNNCGGCGYAGCDALAKAICVGSASASACPVGGSEMVVNISNVLGVEAEEREKHVAFVKCAGTCDKTTIKYNYYGVQDCRKLALIPGQGQKSCAYGCMGFGSCVKVCQFDAIHIVDGVAKVDISKCKACSQCIAVCPRSLIELIPYKATVKVVCSSQNKGKDVKAACKVGCIGCGICVKQCEYDAITVVNNLAYIDQSKCTGCGKCAQKCPVKIIQ